MKGLRIVHVLNITRTSENHEEFVSDRALFLSYQGFFWDVSAGMPISVFSLWSFRFFVLLCKRDFSGGKNEV